MIQELVDGICLALSEEFGSDYEIYTESLPQGIEEPCFFVLCISQGCKTQITHRYRKPYQFSIQYFPKSEELNAECQEVIERLCNCLELITAGNAKVRGEEMNGHVENDVLIFTVEYNTFVCKLWEQAEMKQVTTDVGVKE